ncbi:MAG: hypothetical protein VB858_09325 [Planctomycetaceae bacterium]
MSRPGRSQTSQPESNTAIPESSSTAASSTAASSTESSSTESSSTAASATTGLQAGLRKLLVPAAFAGAAVWYILLISLAALTGNPVTLNREQLRQSRLIVSGLVDEHGNVSHINVWKGIAPEGDITVAPFTWPPGNYILPLQSIDRESLKVTPTKLPENRPLVYPATETAIELLQVTLRALERD